jgi:hypothetical protein
MMFECIPTRKAQQRNGGMCSGEMVKFGRSTYLEFICTAPFDKFAFVLSFLFCFGSLFAVPSCHCSATAGGGASDGSSGYEFPLLETLGAKPHGRKLAPFLHHGSLVVLTTCRSGSALKCLHMQVWLLVRV